MATKQQPQVQTFRRRLVLVPGKYLHPSVPSRIVPLGLSSRVTTTIWKKHGDHPAVKKVPPFVHTDGTTVIIGEDGKAEVFKGEPRYIPKDNEGKPLPPGTRMFQMQRCDAVTENEDEATGRLFHHVVLPGYHIIENESDGKVWALSPEIHRAWFTE